MIDPSENESNLASQIMKAKIASMSQPNEFIDYFNNDIPLPL